VPVEVKMKRKEAAEERKAAEEVRGGDAKVGFFYTNRLVRVVQGEVWVERSS